MKFAKHEKLTRANKEVGKKNVKQNKNPKETRTPKTKQNKRKKEKNREKLSS